MNPNDPANVTITAELYADLLRCRERSTKVARWLRESADVEEKRGGVAQLMNAFTLRDWANALDGSPR